MLCDLCVMQVYFLVSIALTAFFYPVMCRHNYGLYLCVLTSIVSCLVAHTACVSRPEKGLPNFTLIIFLTKIFHFTLSLYFLHSVSSFSLILFSLSLSFLNSSIILRTGKVATATFTGQRLQVMGPMVQHEVRGDAV